MASGIKKKKKKRANKEKRKRNDKMSLIAVKRERADKFNSL
jgi:hypothetical protein